MPLININWPRWIKASCVTAFKEIIQSADLYFYVEGTDRRTEDRQSYCEFRLDGPFIIEHSSNFWSIDITINILIVTLRDDKDIYGHERNVGLVATAFTTDISVFRFGVGELDNQGLFGCFQKTSDKIAISNYGQVRNDTRLMQSMIEANYRMNLNF